MPASLPTVPSGPQPAIRFDQVSKTYQGARGSFKALDGVSFDIQSGEFFGLLGPNGAGKTTLISVLDGLARSGAVRITGAQAAPTATSMVVVVTYWLSFEYVRDPRHALEPESASAAMGRGAYHALALLMPHLDDASRAHLQTLASAYLTP